MASFKQLTTRALHNEGAVLNVVGPDGKVLEALTRQKPVTVRTARPPAKQSGFVVSTATSSAALTAPPAAT